jgi:hypothetical protein
MDIRTGVVGPPIPSLEVKLVDVPDMKYTSQVNRQGFKLKLPRTNHALEVKCTSEEVQEDL